MIGDFPMHFFKLVVFILCAVFPLISYAQKSYVQCYYHDGVMVGSSKTVINPADGSSKAQYFKRNGEYLGYSHSTALNSARQVSTQYYMASGKYYGRSVSTIYPSGEVSAKYYAASGMYLGRSMTKRDPATGKTATSYYTALGKRIASSQSTGPVPILTPGAQTSAGTSASGTSSGTAKKK